jgi:hypothetical protein
VDGIEDGRHEWREVPDGVRAEAAHHPGGSVAEIDGSMVPDPNGYVPPEAIVGVYLVSESGEATGEFVHNPRYGRIMDDSSRLDPSEHYLGWLPGVPFLVVRTSIGDLLTEQQAGTELEWLKITADPAYRTAGRRLDTNPSSLIMTRAALCIEFALGLRTATGERAVLVGCFTWAASGLGSDGQRHDQVWLDLGTPLDRASEQLESRLMSVG